MAYDSTQYLRDHIARLEAQLAELVALASQDPELATLAKDEETQLEEEIAIAKKTLEGVGNNSGPEETFTNCIVELRAGTGGEEAKIWMNDLMAMYTRYAELKHIGIEILDETVIKMKGKKAYELFRFESGVHRVQRVPETENQGRIHTSTASVAVFPEIAPTRVEINEKDLEWQFFRSGGKGGQNVNKVSSAVRLIHHPTGIAVTSSQERQQVQNREFALSLLRAQLWELQEEERLKKLGDVRQVIGRAKRSEKIRTYNYPQNRLTDHRIPQSWHDLDRRLQGDLDDVILALQAWERGENTGDGSTDEE